MSKEMSFLEHIDELRSRLLHIIVTMVAIAPLSFLFCIKRFRLWNASVCLPYPDAFDIASIPIRRVQGTFPERVTLVVTSLGQATIAQLHVSIFLDILLGMP